MAKCTEGKKNEDKLPKIISGHLTGRYDKKMIENREEGKKTQN